MISIIAGLLQSDCNDHKEQRRMMMMETEEGYRCNESLDAPVKMIPNESSYYRTDL